VQLSHWHEQFRLLDIDQQDSLASLVFQIAIRRKMKARDYAGLAELLGEADELGLTDCPMAGQAASMLFRLHELNYAVPARKFRRSGAPAA
jgi:hypothetical protein